METNVEGATPYHEYESLEDCQDLCRKMPECLAIDYDRNDPPYKNSRCWIHDEESLVSGTKPQPAVDHYTRVPCNQGPGIHNIAFITRHLASETCKKLFFSIETIN